MTVYSDANYKLTPNRKLIGPSHLINERNISLLYNSDFLYTS